RPCSPCLFTATPPSDIYPLALHDALPISCFDTSGGPCKVKRAAGKRARAAPDAPLTADAAFAWSGDPEDEARKYVVREEMTESRDRKSTRLNSSHVKISYAVFCLKKKKKR